MEFPLKSMQGFTEMSSRAFVDSLGGNKTKEAHIETSLTKCKSDVIHQQYVITYSHKSKEGKVIPFCFGSTLLL